MPAQNQKPTAIESQIALVDASLNMLATIRAAGINRNLGEHVPCQMDAANDLDAIETWLASKAKNKHTQRAYRREIYRLLLWCADCRGKAFSDLQVGDINAFHGWLAFPEIPQSWSDRNLRVIDGPLSANSQTQALLIVQACFRFLVSAGYLRFDPFVLVDKAPIVLIEAKQEETHDAPPPDRWFVPELWNWLLEWVESERNAAEGDYAKARLERASFLLIWMYHTAPRRSEVVRTSMAAIRETSAGIWAWYVRGKGGTEIDVDIDAPAIEALQRYRLARGMPPLPSRQERNVPLVAALDGTAWITDGHLNRTLQSIFTAAAKATDRPDWAGVLQEASAHWLRHTLASHSAASGIPMHLTQKRLRHKSPNTTQKVYIHARLEETHAAFAKLGNRRS